MKNILLGGLLLSALVMGQECRAAEWIKQDLDVPNKNVEANYYDGKSVKVVHKALNWTEKYVLTDFGSKAYSKHLAKFPACKEGMSTLGPVTQHQLDFQIQKGKYRLVAKRNYNKDNKLVCTDKDMNKELDTTWHEVEYKSPMYSRYYNFVVKYKIGDL